MMQMDGIQTTRKASFMSISCHAQTTTLTLVVQKILVKWCSSMITNPCTYSIQGPNSENFWCILFITLSLKISSFYVSQWTPLTLLSMTTTIGTLIWSSIKHWNISTKFLQLYSALNWWQRSLQWDLCSTRMLTWETPGTGLIL